MATGGRHFGSTLNNCLRDLIKKRGSRSEGRRQKEGIRDWVGAEDLEKGKEREEERGVRVLGF